MNVCVHDAPHMDNEAVDGSARFQFFLINLLFLFYFEDYDQWSRLAWVYLRA
jgi:hypothetical protein